MIDIGEAALVFLGLAFAVHFISIALAYYRVTRSNSAAAEMKSVSILRPVCGVEPFDRATLNSTFKLRHPDYEIIFCSAKEYDPAVKLVEGLVARWPDRPAKLLIGDDRPTKNPKLNNLVKGWSEARAPWIVLADSNVLMPTDYLSQLAAAWRHDTGLVCSPPAGSHPIGCWAEIECAFLNTYQARWQLAADTAGFGFAQGKTMLWRRALLDEAGGLEVLGYEAAEDAAATKIVRRSGKRVRLVDRPFAQPLGLRTGKQVLDRQIRWAKLRRSTFARYYIPEVLTGSAPALAAAALSATEAGVEAPVAAAAVVALWYVPEAMLNRAAGWHTSLFTPIAWLTRDLLIPFVWMMGWMGNGFTWRGNDMSAVVAADLNSGAAAFAASEPCA